MKVNIVTLAITLTLGIILTGSLLMPTIESGAIKETNTQESGTYTYYATDEMDGQIYSISDGKLAYNGEALGNTAVHMISSNFRVMFYNGSMTMFDSTMSINPAVKTLTINADGSYTVVTTADATIESTVNLDWFVGPCTQDKANYVEALMTAITGTIDPNSIIYGAFYGTVSDGTTTLGNTATIIGFKGTVGDIETIGFVRPSGSPWTEGVSTTEFTISFDEESRTYSTSGMGAIVTVGDYTTTTASNAFSMYIPLEYTAVADNPMNDLLKVLPILVIISLVLAATGAIITKRD